MPTSDWSIPTGKSITGATYIKDTDNNISATIEDLVDWCNNSNGTYNDWTLTGLRTDFLSVSTAQAITAVKTVDTLGAIDFTNGELRIGGVAVTSTAAELNILDGVTSTTEELNILDGVTATATEINVLDGIPATLTAIELGYIDGVTSSVQTQIDGKASLSGATFTGAISGTSATFTGQVKGITPVGIDDLTRKDYVDAGLALKSPLASPTFTGTVATSALTIGGLNAIADSSKSLTANGYQFLSNGLIIQWGSFTTTSTGDQVHNFPIAFTTGCLSFAAVENGALEASSFGCKGFTATTFTINTSSTSQNGYYIAIGY